jgi:uncharacterized protein
VLDVDNTPPRSSTSHFIWPAQAIEATFKRPLYRRLLSSRAVRRLNDIRFLGAIDYFVHPIAKRLARRRHTRLEHTLGVAYLALQYSQLAELSSRDEELIVSAALLHDVGHAPLSHSMEPIFREIIHGCAPRGLGIDVRAALSAAGISPSEVISLINGSSRHPYSFVFSHPINIDTIDAICRSETYIKPNPISPDPTLLLRALMKPDVHQAALDNFWALKNEIYSTLINSPVGILADYLSLSYIKKNIDDFTRDDFFLSETSLKKRHGDLFAILRLGRDRLATALDQNVADASDRQTVAYVERCFYIDLGVSPKSPDRYKQKKTRRVWRFGKMDQLSQWLRQPQSAVALDYDFDIDYD